MAFLNEYELLDKLGDGSFAQVYKVRHNELGYVRAIRVLKDMITDKNSKQYEDFLKECKFLLRLGNSGHPNIVRIYQPRLIDHKAFWEMDYVEGQTADDFIKENNGVVSIDEIKRFLLDISNALAYCHVDNYRFSLSKDEDRDCFEFDPNDSSRIIISEEKRKKLIKKYCIVHNDIKSNNIMRKFDGSYILLDFGLAFNTSGQSFSRSSLMNHGGVEYKAPEKWSKDRDGMTERTDIYSFGIVLYEMLTGRVPFPFDNNLSQEQANYEVSEQHKKIQPPAIEPLRKAAYEKANPGKTYVKDYPDWLEQVILKCLEKDPSKRYTNAKELYEEVEQNAKIATTPDNVAVQQLNDQINRLNQELSVLAREKEMMSNAQTGANNETVLKLNKQIEALHTEIANALKINTGKDSKIEQLEQNNHTLQDEVADLKFRSSDNKPKKRYGLYIVFLVVAVIVGGLAYSIGYDEGKASQPRESAELLNLRIANSNLQTEITTLRNRQGTTNNPAQQNEITRLTTENNQLKTENATLRNQQSGSSNNSALQRDIDQLRQQIRQKDATINEQRTRITELERQNKILIDRM